MATHTPVIPTEAGRRFFFSFAPANESACEVEESLFASCDNQRFYGEWGGLSRASDSNTSRWKIAYAVAALLVFIPLIFAADGCGGGATNSPATQKSSIVTPSGTSILVNTQTATNASGKALQMPLIQLTLVVN